MSRIDISGMRFGRLTAIKFSHSSRGAMWLCQCDCGKEVVVKGTMLRNGHTKSCGCLASYINKQRCSTHELCGTPTYITWDSMIQRCTNPKKFNYRRYGGRGIIVCEKWLTFEGFIEDMGLRPPKFTLDRKDNDKGYCKENCRWVSQKVQANNTSRNVVIEHGGKKLTVSQWAQNLGISISTLNNRLFRGKWPIEDALNPKLQKGVHKYE